MEKKSKPDYENNCFSWRAWDVQGLWRPEELRRHLMELNLIGRTVRDLRFIGFCYDLDRTWIEERAYLALGDLPEKDRHALADYERIDPAILFSCSAEIDEPLLIRFDDGDILELCVGNNPRYYADLNRIPWNIKAGINRWNADANVLFAGCVGQRIAEVEVHGVPAREIDIMPGLPENDPEMEVVSHIILRFANGDGLHITGCLDYCHVCWINAANEVKTLPFWKLKKGLYNYEDLHHDPVTDFSSRSLRLFFGRKGAEQVEQPYYIVFPAGRETELYLGETDFEPLLLAIVSQSGAGFDPYSNHELSRQQWENALSFSERLLSCADWDAMIDSLAQRICSTKKAALLPFFREYGLRVWEQREILKSMLSELKRWSDLAMAEAESVWIEGF